MRVFATLFWALFWLSPAPSLAQAYPDRPIRMLVGYPAGGSVDASARAVAERLGPMLGQPVLIENRAGATGNIAAELLTKAAPDGYTLYMGTSINAVSVSLFKSLAYDPVRDFAPVSKVVVSPSVLVVHPSVPAKNVRELIAYARANPGKLTYGTTGAGSSPHLSAELFSTLAGIRMLHVPYKGAAPLTTDLLGGHVAVTFSNPTSVIPHIPTGRVRAFAVTGARRFSQLPDLPTMIEEGFPDFDLTAWYGVMAPKGTSPDIISRLNDALVKILQVPAVREILEKQGLEPQSSTPAELAAELKNDIAKYAKLLKDAGVTPQ